MIRPRLRRCTTRAALLLLAAVAACGHTGPTRYLSLAAIPPAAAPDPARDPVALGRLAVRWPAAYDRLEVVRPTGDVELQVEELTRWSAAPGELAAAALEQDLQARLPALLLTPAGSPPPPDALNVAVDVIALELRDRTYSLTASVAVDGAAGAAPARRTFTVSAPASGSGAANEAEAVSRLLAQVADRIAPDLAAAASGAAARPAQSASRRPTP